MTCELIVTQPVVSQAQRPTDQTSTRSPVLSLFSIVLVVKAIQTSCLCGYFGLNEVTGPHLSIIWRREVSHLYDSYVLPLWGSADPTTVRIAVVGCAFGAWALSGDLTSLINILIPPLS